MSYCRWSSDNFRSDVYTYAHCDGSWTTHVAARKRSDLDMLPPSPYENLGKYSSFAWLVAYRIYHDVMEILPFVEIDRPHAGETFKDADPQSCADTLRMLKGLGYHVPHGVIECLDEEEEEPAA